MLFNCPRPLLCNADHHGHSPLDGVGFPSPGESTPVPDAPTRAVFEHLSQGYRPDELEGVWCPWCGLLVPLDTVGRRKSDPPAPLIVHNTGYRPRSLPDVLETLRIQERMRTQHGLEFLVRDLAMFEMAVTGIGMCDGSRLPPSEVPLKLSSFEERIAELITEHVYDEQLDYDGPTILRGVREAAFAIHAEVNAALEDLESLRTKGSEREVHAEHCFADGCKYGDPKCPVAR